MNSIPTAYRAELLRQQELVKKAAAKHSTSSSKASKRDVKNWVVVNRETGKVAKTRESGYNRKAAFATRDEARKALREGRVYQDPTAGKVVKAA